MSEEKICHCGHGFLDHGYEKNENPPPHMKSPCKKCECTNFQRPGAKRGAEDRARKKAEEEARKKAEEEARKKAEEEARKKAEEEARKKAVEEARKKEEKRLMLERKEQQRLEQLQNEQKWRERYRHQELFHICHIKNLPSIIEKGLFSRKLAPPGFEDIANQGIITDRRVKWITFASTYFEPLNAMYIRKKQPNECGINNIVVVGFRLDLSKEGIVITDGNAANGKTEKTSYNDHSFVKIMSEIQLETIDAEYKGKGKWPGGETDPDYREHIRIKQSECLVPEKISRDCITSIHGYDDPETISIIEHLIDNSGLRINLKTIDRFQTSIKRG